MEQNNPKFKEISDIGSRMDEYLAEMRGLKDAGKHKEFVLSLVESISEYLIRPGVSDAELKLAAAEVTNEMYIKMMTSDIKDMHSDIYYSVVLESFFDQLARKNIFAFFVLDNTIRDDRFKLLTELYRMAGFETVHPYKIKNLEYSSNYTKFPSKPYREIEGQIDGCIAQRKNILYVEKDGYVNHISKILEAAEGVQDRYVCIFRNKSIDADKRAHWLVGSFGNILKIQ